MHIILKYELRKSKKYSNEILIHLYLLIGIWFSQSQIFRFICVLFFRNFLLEYTIADLNMKYRLI